MPPKTRRTKVMKTLKENYVKTNRNKSKIQIENTKQPRKALADKTNSPPDDPASIHAPVKHVKNTKTTSADVLQSSGQRSHRIRRLPNRYEENSALRKLSNSNSASPEKATTVSSDKVTPTKTSLVFSSPPKSRLEIIESVTTNVRPKRVQRLPDKFNDHTISPIKPVQASTPLVPNKKNKNVNKQIKSVNVLPKETRRNKKVQLKEGKIEESLKKFSDTYNNGRKKLNNDSLSKSKNDSALKAVTTCIATVSQLQNKINQTNEANVLPKQTRRNKEVQLKEGKDEESLTNHSNTNSNDYKHLNDLSESKTDSALKTKEKNLQSKTTVHSKISKRQSNNSSLRLLEDKKPSKRKSSKLDVYEFTFDPNEEPPAKKKKKRVVKKNPGQTKKVTIKSTYDKNLAKALAALKNSVAKTSQPSNPKPTKEKASQQKKNSVIEKQQEVQAVSNKCNDRQHSMRVEDIALQFQENDHPINYSPVYSPVNSPVYSPVNSPIYSPIHSPNPRDSPPPCVNHGSSNAPVNKDPLNLLDDVSFFDEQPVASSSMNCSTKHPLASPWRVEFGNLPIKWPVNAYVKPNMTPAIETSFIDFGGKKKKHIYTDMVPETADTMPQVVENTPNLKQTSIVSFIKEVIEKQSNKKKKNKIISNNSVFEDTVQTLAPHITPQKNNTSNASTSPILGAIPEDVENDNSNLLTEHNTSTPIKSKETHTSVSKSTKIKKNKDVTYFGFDESEDQENISPVKENNKKRSLRPRSRAVLQEINAVKNPAKAVILVAAISKPCSDADNIFNEIKAGTEPPVFTEVYVDGKKSDVTVNESTEIDKEVAQSEVESEDSQSVHLFEDVEIVHHAKPVRKSYGKSKKVTFRHNSNSSDSDAESNKSSNEDNLDDLSFKIPSVKEKKVIKRKKPKKLMSKKEEKEAEAWAAGFNSMCEDIDEYDLVVE